MTPVVLPDIPDDSAPLEAPGTVGSWRRIARTCISPLVGAVSGVAVGVVAGIALVAIGIYVYNSYQDETDGCGG